MNNVIVSILLIFSVVYTAKGETTLEVPVIDVIDGDTFRTIFTLPAPLHEISIRIRGIDTPESTWRAKCPAEQVSGKKATNHLQYLLKDAKIVTLTNFSWDKYGKRVDADVSYKGVNIGQRMLDDGYAKPYTGKGQKPNWCN